MISARNKTVILVRFMFVDDEVRRGGVTLS